MTSETNAAPTPVTTGVNAMQFPAAAAVLNEIVSQVSGKTPLAPINTSQFVSVAQTALLAGYDPVINAISQVLSRTIFSIRPYTRKFAGLMADSVRYGNHIRKLQVIDKPIRDDDTLGICGDNPQTDMYSGCCPEVLQTNFYGQFKYERCLKIFRDQLDMAFSGPDEFSRFIAMLMTNVSDSIEQAHEATARACMSNFIAGKISGDTGNVIHLLTEYNTATGSSFTATTIMSPDNFPDFVRWVYARINSLSDMMTERSYKYHINITGKEVQRHSPKRLQKVYLNAQFVNMVDALVRTVNYDNSFMRLTDFEKVGYWQSIDSPEAINITPVYMDTTGSLVTPDPVTYNKILGVIFDEEAAGYTVINQWSAPTPFNARGGFSVMWWHFTDRYWNDFTENGIVLALD